MSAPRRVPAGDAVGYPRGISAVPTDAAGRVDWTRVPPEQRFRPQGQAARAFVIGPSKVNPWDEAHGIDPAQFRPEEYARYAAISDIWYGALRILADNLSKLPLRAYHGDPEDNPRQLGPTHPANRFIKRPNPFWSTRRMVQMWVWDRYNFGTVFNVLERGESGRERPRELWRVRPDRVRVVPDSVNYIKGFIYEVDGRELTFGPGEMLWMPNPNPIDDYSGLAPLAPARLGLDTAHAAMRANHAIHANGSRISGIVSPSDQSEPLTDDDMDFIEQFFGDLYRGVENAHKLAIFPRGLRLDPLTLLPKDAEYIEQLRWMVGVTSRVTGVPPTMLADLSRATFNNVDAHLLSLYEDAIIPLADFLADELSLQVGSLFGPNVFYRFDYSGVSVLQQDQTEIARQFQIVVDKGVPLNVALKHYLPDLLPQDSAGYPWGDVPIWEAQGSARQAPAQASGATGNPSGQDPDDPADDPSAFGEVADEPEERDVLALLAELRAEVDGALAFDGPRHRAFVARQRRRLAKREAALALVLADVLRRQVESIVGKLRSDLPLDAVLAAPFDADEWRRKYQERVQPVAAELATDAALEALDDIGCPVTECGSDGDWLIPGPLAVELSEAAAERVESLAEALGGLLRAALRGDEGSDREQLIADVRAAHVFLRDEHVPRDAKIEAQALTLLGGLAGARFAGEAVSGVVWLRDPACQSEHRLHAESHGQRFELAAFEAAAFAGECRCGITFVRADGSVCMPLVQEQTGP